MDLCSHTIPPLRLDVWSPSSPFHFDISFFPIREFSNTFVLQCLSPPSRLVPSRPVPSLSSSSTAPLSIVPPSTPLPPSTPNKPGSYCTSTSISSIHLISLHPTTPPTPQLPTNIPYDDTYSTSTACKSDGRCAPSDSRGACTCSR